MLNFVTIDEVTERFDHSLPSDLRTRFRHRLAAEPEAARAESVTFDFLVAQGLAPTVHESPSGGGADFECSTGDSRFAVEVTAIRSSTMSDRSGVTPEMLLTSTPFNFGTTELTKLIANRIADKQRQGSAYTGPSVLVVVSEHPLAFVFFEIVASELLTGTPQISFGIADETRPESEFTMTTSLTGAAHIREHEGWLDFHRRAFAATLLIAAGGGGCTVEGVRNPAPQTRLPRAAFPNVPFVSIELQGLTLTTRRTHGRTAHQHTFASYL